MKIVIDIPDAICERFGYEYSEQNLISKDINEAILDAFCNGIWLPKGHGRLGDLDALEKEMVNGIKAGNLEEGYEEYGNINNVDDCVDCVKYADTIIAADTGETGAISYINLNNIDLYTIYEEKEEKNESSIDN